ncbi:MAG: hypothetical protein ACRC8A_02255 [Microcoleaceae cyanobacterium]
MPDAAVAAAVNALKSKWTVLKATDPKVGVSKFPGNVRFNVMVATDVKTSFLIGGRAIHMLELLADDTVDAAKVIDWALTGGLTDDPAHRNIQSSSSTLGRMIGREVTIFNCPKTLTVDRKGGNQIFRHCTVRFPQIATVDSINNWIYRHCGATKPTGFRIAGGRLFKVEDIGDAKLGSLSARYKYKA